jgi:hypothetical protein
MRRCVGFLKRLAKIRLTHNAVQCYYMERVYRDDHVMGAYTTAVTHRHRQTNQATNVRSRGGTSTRAAPPMYVHARAWYGVTRRIGCSAAAARFRVSRIDAACSGAGEAWGRRKRSPFISLIHHFGLCTHCGCRGTRGRHGALLHSCAAAADPIGH